MLAPGRTWLARFAKGHRNGLYEWQQGRRGHGRVHHCLLRARRGGRVAGGFGGGLARVRNVRHGQRSDSQLVAGVRGLVYRSAQPHEVRGHRLHDGELAMRAMHRDPRVHDMPYHRQVHAEQPDGEPFGVNGACRDVG